MEKFWGAALKATGSVAVVGFILWTVVQNVFEKDMLKLFGTEQSFIITIVVLAGLMAVLITAIFLQGGKSNGKLPASNNEKRTVRVEKSTIEGDLVIGDKTINHGDK